MAALVLAATPVQPLPTTPASADHRLSETSSSLMAPLFTLWDPAYCYPVINYESRRYAE